MNQINEFTLMEHSSDAVSINDETFRRHGITGVYSPIGDRSAQQATVALMVEAFRTKLPVETRSESGFAVSTTGMAHPLLHGGLVVVAGQPYFRNKALADQASLQGIAAALATGYLDYSQAIFQQLYGSFCCAIIDTSEHRVLLAIDRLGQNSLYYHSAGPALHFGSSAGAALAGTEGVPSLADQGIYNYLYFHMVPSPGSIYRGLGKIPPRITLYSTTSSVSW
ncbi:MAG: hypothetical protein R3E50_13660 [Halioglobus sp.]